MRPIRIFAAILYIACATVSASAQGQGEDAAFTATEYLADGKWTLSNDSYSCSVRRDFTKDGETLSLVMRGIHPGAAIQFGVFGRGVERHKPTIRAGFIPSNGMSTFEKLASANLGERPGFVFSGALFPEIRLRLSDGVDRQQVQEELDSLIESTTHFAINGLTAKPVALRTNAISLAMAALDDCVWDRLAGMGITQEGLASVRKAPTPRNFKNWSAKIAKVYPKEALKEGFDGLVEMRIVVDEKGRPRFCHVADQLVARSLREAACEAMMEHAQYEAALDDKDEAVTALAFQSVRYTFPPRVDAHGMLVHDE